MKRYFDLKVLTSLLAITILFAYCKKGDTGATGATGAAGTAGAAGAAGATGAQGPKGDTGTANVIYSNWLTVTFAPDTVRNGVELDTLGFFADISALKLDTSILSHGEIKVYLNLGTSDDPYVVPLPYFDVYSGISITPAFLLHDISLYGNADASTIDDSGNTYQQYRYILIPGGTTGKRIEPNWKNYKEVKAFYHLKD